MSADVDWTAADHVPEPPADVDAMDAVTRPQDRAQTPVTEPPSYEEQLDMDVAKRVRTLRIEQLAREQLTRERNGPPTPFDAGTLAEILDRTPPPPPRVQDLIPADAGTLVVAQRKTGKTTFELNLARSLITGADFLGTFGVRPVDGRVGLLNYEVTGSQVATWAREHDVPSDRLFLVNLRGRTNPFRNPDQRQQLAELLRRHEVETLIVDPFGRAYTGDNQNDSGEVGAWLSDLDQFARSPEGVHCTDVILTAHAGWNGERTRGSTALEDWADSIITITRAKEDETRRFLKAEGRDVHVDEDQLAYDPTTRTLTLTGAGSRRILANTERVEALIPLVRRILRDNPDGMSGNALDTKLRELKNDLTHSKGDGAKAAKILHHNGEATSTKRGNAVIFTLISPYSPELPTGTPETSLTSLSKGEVSRETGEPTNSPSPQETS